MKKILISAVAAMSLSTVLMAGGDIAPVEPAVIVPVEVEVAQDTGFYAGIAYGYSTAETEVSKGVVGGNITYFDSVDYSSVMLQAGYKACDYFAVEGRYWFGFEESARDYTLNQNWDVSIDTWAIYAKPMYPVTPALDVYALLGYASSDIEASTAGYTYKADTDMDGFSWGVGASYSVTSNIDLFIDYTNMYNDDYKSSVDSTVEFEDTIDAWNFGVTYRF